MERDSNPKLKYNTDRLDQIPIIDVLEAMNVERVGKTKKFHCFNGAAHKSDDKSASLSVRSDGNYCQCFGCTNGGGPVIIATAKFGDFKEACEWLHYTFNIPFLDGSKTDYTDKNHTNKPKAKEIEYLSYDPKKAFSEVSVDEYLPYYAKLNDERKLKLVYTSIYRFSLSTDQRAKKLYHEGRGIRSDHPMIDTIGYISKKDLSKLVDYLKQTFPIEDLVRFNLFNDESHQSRPLAWKYWTNTGFCVAPAFDLYSDMCNGMTLRNTDANLPKKFPKEFQVSNSKISQPLPFGLTKKLLDADPSIPVHITEGYVDALSLGNEKLAVAAAGVNGLKEEMIKLFDSKVSRLTFDMDNAGKRAMYGYHTVTVKRKAGSEKENLVRQFTCTTEGEREKEIFLRRVKKWAKTNPTERKRDGLKSAFLKAGVKVEVVNWTPKIHNNLFVKDINEILQEYRNVYKRDLTGIGIETAVKTLQQSGIDRPLYRSG